MLRTFQNFLDKNKIQSSFVDENRTMIEFTIDGLHYIFSYIISDDPYYVRIVLPNAGQIDESNLETIRLLYEISRSYKVGKAYCINSQIWFSAESFVYNKEGADMLFQRMISVLKDMLNYYRIYCDGNNKQQSKSE